MSYARFGPESDVYVFRTSDPKRKQEVWLCMSCSLVENDQWGDSMFDDRVQMIAHLGAHREAGEKVPQRTINRLMEEQAQLN